MLDRGMKKLDVWDLGLTKFAVMFFVLAVLAACPSVNRRVQSTRPALFFATALLAAIRPLYRFFA